MPERVETGEPDIWVVGVDGSENARHAALWAARHVVGRAGELRLVAAWGPPVGAHPYGAFAVPPTVLADVEAAARAPVEELAESLRSVVPLPVTTGIGCGGAAAQLLDAAPSRGLLVVGTRGRGGFARLLLGSTSTQVATHAEVPTAVVPLGSEIGPVDRIVVGVDGSPNSLAALDWAIRFAPRGARVDGVMVWDVSPLAVGADRYLVPEASGAAEERLEHLLSSHSAGHDLDVRAKFVEGAPRTELERLAANADLLVTGARGHGGVGAALLGSVSTWLLHHTRVPMVVVPRPDPTASSVRSS